MLDGNRIDNPFYVQQKDRQNERKNTPIISEEGELFSPTSVSSVAVSPQPAAKEESGEGIPTDNMA